MKYILLLICQVTLLFSARCQESISGTIDYTFLLNLKGIPIERNSVLEFCNEKSIFYHSRGQGVVMVDRKGNKGDITMTVTTHNDNSGDAVLDFYNQDSTGNTYYFDMPSKNLIVRELVFLKAIIYEEKIPNIKWKVLNEKKVIEDFNCLKATTVFRGRNYTAWFTHEIPLSYGPWKLNGLPGLILEVEDDKNEVKFSATKISFFSSCKEENKIIPPTHGKKITLEKAKTIYEDEQRKLVRQASSGLNRNQEFTGIKKLNLLEKFDKDE